MKHCPLLSVLKLRREDSDITAVSMSLAVSVTVTPTCSCGGEQAGWNHLPVAAAAMMPVSMSLPGFEGGQQDAVLALPLLPASFKVEGICDIAGNQDLDGVSTPGRQR